MVVDVEKAMMPSLNVFMPAIKTSAYDGVEILIIFSSIKENSKVRDGLLMANPDVQL